MESNSTLRKALARRRNLNRRRGRFWKKPGRSHRLLVATLNGILRKKEWGRKTKQKTHFRLPCQVFMKLADFIDFKLYRFLQSKLLQCPQCCFEVTFTCVIVSALTLPPEITRVEAFIWKQRYLALQGYTRFETEISRSHVNDHAFDQGGA